jgi:hypothetical protein
MAANTLSAWTTDNNVPSGFYSTYCTIAVDAANAVAWTNKTPTFLDPSKPWTLIVSLSGALDTAATPLSMYIGYNSSAALSGTASVTASNAAYYVQLLDDGGYATPTVPRAIYFDPNQAVADVVTYSATPAGYKVKPAIAPYYLFNFTAGSGTLLAVTITLRIIQKR